MAALPPPRRADLRAYWMLLHSSAPERALLSVPAGYQDQLNVLSISRGVDPGPKKPNAALLDRIAKANGLTADDVAVGLREGR